MMKQANFEGPLVFCLRISKGFPLNLQAAELHSFLCGSVRLSASPSLPHSLSPGVSSLSLDTFLNKINPVSNRLYPRLTCSNFVTNFLFLFSTKTSNQLFQQAVQSSLQYFQPPGRHFLE